ncbi:type II secretion system protein J [Puniceibacterium sp. IMCC21224]|uniref:PulJ/GspJ family protein n=1 Tax=Puniceibacterium sp. IMCC21224 TaxID=1618204 RepID=UPI00064DD97A|nr:type II secretion system protein GspJ [Puniceibacterium sp. IMCC21224]KMK64006.1 prepilin-type N-terminal cleavage/methylation domain-containing protein [Puniceibacterium sp. IMCC21224]
MARLIPCRSHSTKGLTLIELVVSMAIFALVATMGLQALTGALRMRDRLIATEAGSAELAYALGLLRQDLAALTPMIFHPPGAGGPRSSIDLTPGGRMLSLSLSGQPDLPPLSGPGLHRVDWRLVVAPGQDTGQLTRQVWPALNPASAAVVQPEITVLDGVRSLGLRTFWPRIGWITGSTSAQVQQSRSVTGSPADGDAAQGVTFNGYSSQLPDGVELTLDTARFGRLVLIESLK